MNTEILKSILEQLHFSAPLPSESIGAIAAASRLEKIAAGNILFREGTKNANLYIVRTGLIALEMHVPGRGNVRVITLGPGEMVAWSALLGEGKMTSSAVAASDAELVVIPSDELRRLCSANKDFGFRLMERIAVALSKRLVATRLQLLDLFAHSREAAR